MRQTPVYHLYCTQVAAALWAIPTAAAPLNVRAGEQRVLGKESVMRKLCALICAGVLAVMAGCDVVEEPSTDVASATEWEAATPGSIGSTGTAPPQKRGLARGNLAFVEGFRAGYERAATEGKPMLVFFTAEWCHFCHAMAAEALIDERVVALSKRFVCVLVDADAEARNCRNLRVDGFPTVLFLSPRGQELNRVEGKKSGVELVRAMHEAFQAMARSLNSQPLR